MPRGLLLCLSLGCTPAGGGGEDASGNRVARDARVSPGDALIIRDAGQPDSSPDVAEPMDSAVDAAPDAAPDASPDATPSPDAAPDALDAAPEDAAPEDAAPEDAAPEDAAADAALPESDLGWCRLQFPLDIEVAAGETATVFGRVFEEGVTDRTDATDPHPELLAQVGVGPSNSAPPNGWAWLDAEPNPGWNAAAQGEPNNDEYMGIIGIGVGPGDYAFAYRFSNDSGASWTYCDRGAGPGMDGAENGYQVENAGTLTVRP